MRKLSVITFLFAVLMPAMGAAVVTYVKPEQFLTDAFAGSPPTSQQLWIHGGLKSRVRKILGHDMEALRVRYWHKGDRTAWILEEIGKERPITIGFIVGSTGLEEVRVLIFRESRGWEIRYPFFTDQFRGIRLLADDRLSKPVDGISGATLSVRAVTRLAQLALVLHKTVLAGQENEQ